MSSAARATSLGHARSAVGRAACGVAERGTGAKACFGQLHSTTYVDDAKVAAGGFAGLHQRG
eukprot:8458135-Lingulodinium_polyedra.AAC.1